MKKMLWIGKQSKGNISLQCAATFWFSAQVVANMPWRGNWPKVKVRTYSSLLAMPERRK